jgi:hypothetical protein
MTYAIIESGVVVNAVVASAEYAAEQGWVALPEGAGIGWAFDGTNWTAPTAPTKTPEEVQAEIVAATQTRLDAFARTRHYDDIKSASDYAGCSVPRFDVEGTYCRDARAETWAALYDMLDEVQAGTRPMPTGFADIEAELPPLVWPA